jgi:DNA-binding transcriptional LysR family regulator
MQVEAALRAAGVTPHVVLTLPSGEGIARAVEAGIGVAIISRLIVLEAIRAGRLVAVPIPNLALARTFRSIRLRRQTPSPAALALLLMLERERGGEAMPSRR